MEKLYQLNDPSTLLTPCLLVYPSIIRANLTEMLRIAGDVSRLRPHVKTHKTAEIIRLEKEMGIEKHKCATLAEAKMLADCQVRDLLVAYPQVGPNIATLAELVASYPQTRFSTLVDNLFAAEALSQHFATRGLQLNVMIDLDTGMHRTGIEPGEKAIDLVRAVAASAALRFVGLHVYDGQNHQSNLAERQAAVSELMLPVFNLVSELKRHGIQTPALVCGGTPTFPVFAALECPEWETQIELSPGTCVLSDYNYGNDYRDMDGFQHAALLLTRVISKPGKSLLTLDLGYKAVASDPPAGRRCHLLDVSGTQIQHSEEHLVIESPAAQDFAVGDAVYAVPAHICPTVALHSQLHVVERGEVTGQWQVAARDRINTSLATTV